MRLVHAATKKLEQVSEDVPYAILSHRWGQGEVQYQDVHQPYAVKMAGYAKIERCCAKALEDGYDYVWIDTCCIDKSSSSELSEAINSMYRWYRRARVCYAYLNDVRSGEDPDDDNSSFSQSTWFKRGWTLQELVAPSSVVFFASDWTEIGTKANLAWRISHITHIGVNVLRLCYPGEVSVAERMSWAAARETTREEDRAYSLLGLFGISMPAIYGEGKNAFVRLQLEIMKTSSDQSIFAWQTYSRHENAAGLLAPSPDEFLYCHNVERLVPDSFMQNFVCHFSNVPPKPDYLATNNGIHITLPLCPSNDNTYIAALSCHRATVSADSPPLFVYLRRTDHLNQYVRANTGVVGEVQREDFSKFQLHDIFVKEDDPSLFQLIDQRRDVFPTSYDIRVKIVQAKEHGFALVDRAPTVHWSETGGYYLLKFSPGGGYTSMLFRNMSTGEGFAVLLGVHNFHIWTWIHLTKSEETHATIQQIFSAAGGDAELASRRWLALDSTSADLENNMKVVVRVRNGGRFAPEGDGGYFATITVVPSTKLAISQRTGPKRSWWRSWLP